MTYWYRMFCPKCRVESPPVFVVFNSRISLYPLDKAATEVAGEWLDEHVLHADPVLLHEEHPVPRDSGPSPAVE